MASSRQLAAIMFADIAGYTAMMQEDEEFAMELRNKLQTNLEKEVQLHNGRIIEFRGDGALVFFTSSIEAVRTAIDIQLKMQETPVVPLRIGLHTGDVALEGGSIFGDGVNIASRMESFAVPGSIFLSAKVYDDIKNQKDIKVKSLGKFLLKNVKDQIEIFAVSNEGLIVPEENDIYGKGLKAPRYEKADQSIIVLPFINLSNDPDQEYFSDGLTEELITNLSKVKDIRVVSRTTSMRYKNTEKDMMAIGRENNASYIMEGSIRVHKDNLRITAQLIDAAKDVHVWAETYRGTVDDVFDIQEMVSEKIADALRIRLTREEQRILEKRYTDDTEAYQLYLKGRHYWQQRNEQGLQLAISHFEKALVKDPDYALAWTGLADSYSLMGEYSNISRRVLYPKQMAAVNRALEIDNKLAEAHISLAISLMLNEWDWKKSESEFKTGLALNPKYATGRHWYAEWLLFTGKTIEALREISLAVDLEPASPGILKDKGIVYYYTAQYSRAIDMAFITLELDSNFSPAYRLLSLSYQGMKMYDKAMEENEHWGELTGNIIKSKVALADIFATAGRKEDAENLIAELERDDLLTQNDYRGMAQVYASLGKNDIAFEWLEKSYQHHEESLCSLKVDPKMDPLRGDPKFNKFLKKIGLAD